ncbi:hypothetical protein BC834DRAFT_312672 [Gloeopeniophorella convolvens]|nr:hypothetical protein BC834DRAFT_312672 [Gloeopeniophorella convolvens]
MSAAGLPRSEKSSFFEFCARHHSTVTTVLRHTFRTNLARSDPHYKLSIRRPFTAITQRHCECARACGVGASITCADRVCPGALLSPSAQQTVPIISYQAHSSQHSPRNVGASARFSGHQVRPVIATFQPSCLLRGQIARGDGPQRQSRCSQYRGSRCSCSRYLWPTAPFSTVRGSSVKLMYYFTSFMLSQPTYLAFGVVVIYWLILLAPYLRRQ